MNKKLTAIILAMLAFAGLCACWAAPGGAEPETAAQTTEPAIISTLYQAVYAEAGGKIINTDLYGEHEIYLVLSSDGTCILELGSGRSDGLWTADGEKLSLNFETSSLCGSINAGTVTLGFEMPGYESVRLVLAETWLAEGLVPEPEQEPAGTEPVPINPVEWWGGSWYGWWGMYRQDGEYTKLDNDWWDLCAEISFDEHGRMVMLLWDSDGSYDRPAGSVTFSTKSADGTAVSLFGRFFGKYISEREWTISPSQSGYENTIVIENADVKDSYGSYRCRIVLRRWGSTWDELEGDPSKTLRYSEMYPAHYEDWYLPLIRQGAPMPDSIGG